MEHTVLDGNGFGRHGVVEDPSFPLPRVASVSRNQPYLTICFSLSVLYSHINQVSRGGVTLNARLAQLLTTDMTSPNPRWLIKYDGLPYKDEEVYEHTFGKTIRSASPAASSPASSKGGGDAVEANNEAPTLEVQPSVPDSDTSPDEPEDSGSAKGTGADETLAKGDKKQKNAKSAPTSTNNSSNEDDDDTSLPSGADEAAREKARVSAREARSRRRQAKVIEEIKQPKRGTASGFKGVPKNMKRSREEGEECIKIPFLTGTLYLYRGRKKRRAEFIRRI